MKPTDFDKIRENIEQRARDEELVELVTTSGPGRVFFEEMIKAYPDQFATPSPATQSPNQITPMSPAEAEAFGNTKMQFGKHSGSQIKNIDTDYLSFIASQSTFYRNLNRYLLTIESEVTND